ncbi:MAG: exodeoxyribonuclease VII small subunit [Panacagrimonas sp.]
MPKRSEPTVPTLPFEAAADVPLAEESVDAVARFEQDMQELEGIVAQMEKGDLRLEDSLKLFERGTQLARSCRKSLDTAELKIRKLLDEDSDDTGV